MEVVLEWISVKERMPEEMQNVIFASTGYRCGYDRNFVEDVIAGHYEDGRFYADNDDITRFDVVHWMPWPSFPKPAEKAKNTKDSAMTDAEINELIKTMFNGDVSVYNSAIEITSPHWDGHSVVRSLLDAGRTSLPTEDKHAIGAGLAPQLIVAHSDDGTWRNIEYVRKETALYWMNKVQEVRKQMDETLKAKDKRIAELENALMYVNEHAKSVGERCRRIAADAPSQEKSMFDLLGE